EGGEPLARRGRVLHERSHIDALTVRRERSQPLDAFVEKDGRAVKVAVPPVVKADADLEDAVVEAAVGRSRRSPEELERLVLLEELAAVELLDAGAELRRWGLVAAPADRLVDRAAGDALWRSCGLAVAASRRRARTRGSSGSGARPR